MGNGSQPESKPDQWLLSGATCQIRTSHGWIVYSRSVRGHYLHVGSDKNVWHDDSETSSCLDGGEELDSVTLLSSFHFRIPSSFVSSHNGSPLRRKMGNDRYVRCLQGSCFGRKTIVSRLSAGLREHRSGQHLH